MRLHQAHPYAILPVLMVIFFRTETGSYFLDVLSHISFLAHSIPSPTQNLHIPLNHTGFGQKQLAIVTYTVAILYSPVVCLQAFRATKCRDGNCNLYYLLSPLQLVFVSLALFSPAGSGLTPADYLVLSAVLVGFVEIMLSLTGRKERWQSLRGAGTRVGWSGLSPVLITCACLLLFLKSDAGAHFLYYAQDWLPNVLRVGEFAGRITKDGTGDQMAPKEFPLFAMLVSISFPISELCAFAVFEKRVTVLRCLVLVFLIMSVYFDWYFRAPVAYWFTAGAIGANFIFGFTAIRSRRSRET